MRQNSLARITALCLAILMALAPASASAAVLLKRGSRGTEVKMVQATLKEKGYFTYPRVTGYYGRITERAVKRFQKDQGISADGKVGKVTRGALYGETKSFSTTEASSSNKETFDSSKAGSFDWFSKVQYIWDRGEDAVITDVDTGRTFKLRRTFGRNHADVEPLTKKDANTIKEIWGGWTWTRRAVIVQVDGYTMAGSLSAMPHAGVDDAPAVKILRRRSGGYGRGYNLDAVKNNGVSGVMDLHFKNSRTHGTNSVKRAHQRMVKKAATYIERMNY